MEEWKREELIVLDGGMGTLLQAKGLQSGETPEDWNVERPEDVLAVHRAYVEAGSQIVYANTFGANPLKYHGMYDLEEVISAGIANAKKAKSEGRNAKGKNTAVRLRLGPSPLVALDIGPTGRLLKPAGDLDFEEAVAAFAETIRIATRDAEGQRTEDSGQTAESSSSTVRPSPFALGPDLIVIETMSDLREVKAAVIAAKENCDLPIYVTVTLDEDGRLLTGASVEAVAALLESLDVAAYGFNCGLGPDRMLPHVKRLAQLSTKPIIVKPNAGLPSIVDGRTVFTVGPEEFAADVAKLVDAGARIVGGCCGTTPGHIGKIRRRGGSPRQNKEETSDLLTRRAAASTGITSISSGTTVVELRPHQGLIIGERINPTGKKALKEAYAKGDTAYVLREAVRQTEAGAEILDVNCGVPGLDEATLLEATVENVQSVVTCPLQVDTADPAALERALRHVNGKPLVNSVNGKRTSMDAVFPLVRKYGGTIVALCLDESGIPATSEGRLEIARRILAEGAKYGFEKKDFVFDALTLSVSADPQAAVVTLETVRRLTEELGVNTVLGVSNVSFGLPNRPALNNAMYALAKRAGLSAAIANPSLIRDELDPAAEDVLLGRDVNCTHWIARQSVSDQGQPEAKVQGEGEQRNLRPSPFALRPSLCAAIRRGLKEDARAAAEAALRDGKSAMDVIQEGIVPALEEVGRGFEKGTVYLPQLLMAADAAGEAFAVVKAGGLGLGPSPKGQVPTMEDSAVRPSSFALQPAGRPIVLATVKGDIHDIGKNIVRALLENYGFEVIDLGRDVPPEKIVETAKKTNAMMVGLSALMTTTVGAMAETIRLLKASGLTCKTCVGGAVVTQEYADSIGADFYAKDAMRTVRFAESLIMI